MLSPESYDYCVSFLLLFLSFSCFFAIGALICHAIHANVVEHQPPAAPLQDIRTDGQLVGAN